MMTQMDFDFRRARRDALLRSLGLSSRETRLLIALDTLGDLLPNGEQNRNAFDDELGVRHVVATKEEISSLASCSTRTVLRAIQDLEQMPYLDIEMEANSGHWYSINWPRIFEDCHTEMDSKSTTTTVSQRYDKLSQQYDNLSQQGDNLSQQNLGFQRAMTPIGEGEGISSSSPEGWAKVKELLRECRVGAVKIAVREAAQNGWSPAEVEELCNQFLKTKFEGLFAWSPGLIFQHLKRFDPGTPITVEPSEKWRTAKLKRERAERERLQREEIKKQQRELAGEENLEDRFGEMVDKLDDEELAKLMDVVRQAQGTLFQRYLEAVKSGLNPRTMKSIRSAVLMLMAKNVEAEK